MAPTRSDQESAARSAALEAFRPEGFGFRRHRGSWVKDGDALGAIAVAPLSWQHVHAPSYEVIACARVPCDALSFLVVLQARTWGMPPEELVPANLLAVLADTGGSVLVAYDPSVGFNADGWLGFAIGLGARSGTLVSHMLGVREEARGTRDLGWYLKLIQGYEALRSGHTAATWTFDPMRGANARLNLEKLGAVADAFTVDKYGTLRSELYGAVPSDRLTARWDLVAPATAKRLRQVFEGRYRGPTPQEVVDIPEVTSRSLDQLVAAQPPRLRYRIPGDVDHLMRGDPQEAIRWRRETREVLSALLTTRSIGANDVAAIDPSAILVRERPGTYVIAGFATGLDPSGERVSFYLLERMGER